MTQHCWVIGRMWDLGYGLDAVGARAWPRVRDGLLFGLRGLRDLVCACGCGIGRLFFLLVCMVTCGAIFCMPRGTCLLSTCKVVLEELVTIVTPKRVHAMHTMAVLPTHHHDI